MTVPRTPFAFQSALTLFKPPKPAPTITTCLEESLMISPPRHSTFRGLRDLLSHERNLVIPQTLFIEPVWTRNFLEGVDSGLNPFGPCNGNQFDVAVHITNGENALPARFEIWNDGSTA